VLAHLYLCRGLSTYAIGEITGLDRQRVPRTLRRAGVRACVTLRPRGAGRLRPLRRDDPPGLPQLYQGREARLAADRRDYQHPDHTIRDRLRRYGIAVRTRGGWNREDRRVVPATILEDLYTPLGLTVDEVGRMLGVARNTVLAALRVSGGPPAAAALEPEIETLDRIITWQVKTVNWHLAEGRRLRDKPERITGRKTLPLRRRRVRQSTPRRPGSQPAAGRRKEL
jgi:hypothetical protein